LTFFAIGTPGIALSTNLILHYYIIVGYRVPIRKTVVAVATKNRSAIAKQHMMMIDDVIN
jgi:hypothetical protein